jgi:predicted MarR family transcription regulator
LTLLKYAASTPTIKGTGASRTSMSVCGRTGIYIPHHVKGNNKDKSANDAGVMADIESEHNTILYSINKHDHTIITFSIDKDRNKTSKQVGSSIGS